MRKNNMNQTDAVKDYELMESWLRIYSAIVSGDIKKQKASVKKHIKMLNIKGSEGWVNQIVARNTNKGNRHIEKLISAIECRLMIRRVSINLQYSKSKNTQEDAKKAAPDFSKISAV